MFFLVEITILNIRKDIRYLALNTDKNKTCLSFSIG